MTAAIPFVKGHGTENDFVLVPDLDGALEPVVTPALVRAVCDRRAGLGADGLLRVAPGGPARWFMDYRNADGSVAEMCGNGVRVFVRYLLDAGLVQPGEIPVATRAGVRTVRADRDGDPTVDMGPPRPIEAAPVVGGRAGLAVSMGNPHVVVPLADPAELAALDLTRPPAVTPALPDGQNVEYVLRRGPRAIALRVYERGVGETRSCGTGVCAAVVATIIAGGGAGRDAPWTVDVPGGRLTVTWSAAGPVLLTGPAVLVAAGELRPEWLAGLNPGR